MNARPPWRLGLFGQMAALITLALVIAHVLGYFLLLDQQQRTNLIAASGQGLAEFVEVAERVARESDEGAIRTYLRSRSNFEHRYSLTLTSGVNEGRVRAQGELRARLARALQRAGVRTLAVEAGVRGGPRVVFRRRPVEANGELPPRILFDRPPPGGPPPPPGFPSMVKGAPPPPDRDMRWVMLSAQLANGSWLNVESLWRVPPPGFLPRVIAAEALLFFTILIATLFFARRIARPLDVLSNAAGQIGAPGAPPILDSRGPSEIRGAIDAFNAMSLRVAGLLHEKDELIGAIGHDLRTPLASLRIRAESVADAEARGKMIETLEDMYQLLDDTLEMARLGQSPEPPRLVDASALTESVVSEYRDRRLPATYADSDRMPILCRPALVRRLLRNLIDNAIKFGGQAEVSVERTLGKIVFAIEDRGPGIEADGISHVLKPFVRGETSRNRDTGGAGLGLAIAVRIAGIESAELTLRNREGGGLRAEVRYPSPDASYPDTI